MLPADEEQAALRDLRARDIRGLETLVRLYQVRAIRIAYGITLEQHLAEDVVSDAFIKVYDRIAQLDVDRPFAPWFLRIVVNDAIKAAQKRNRLGAGGDEATWSAEARPDLAPTPEDATLQRDLNEQLAAAIATLPAEQRAMITMRYYLHMSEAEVAEQAGCPVGTVKWRLHAAKAKLRALLISLVG